MPRVPLIFLSGRHVPKGTRGLTLVEVMVGFALLAIAMAGIFALLLQSYRLAARTRCIDESRSVLRTLVTEFMPPTKTTDNPVLFTATSAPTGTGLVWNGTSGTASGLDVQIGEDSGMPVFAHVTRTVSELNETTGVADVSPAGGGNSGRLIQCCLTLGFTAAGQTWSDTVVLTRSTQ